MFGVILTSFGSLFSEIGDLFGKKSAAQGQQDAYAMGFFNLFWAGVLLLAVGVIRSSFSFSLSSLPTFIPRVILEIVQIHAMMLAIIRADRSTYGFIRVFTMPILLGVDFVLGYALTAAQTAGILLITLTLVFTFLSNKMGRSGRWLVLFTAVNGAATTTLFKYDITHFNSVEAEQVIIISILLIYFWIAGMVVSGKNNLSRLFSNKTFLTQSLAQGVASAADSFALMFAPASIIVAAKRSSATTWSMLSGQFAFSEKNFAFKASLLVLLIGGIILLAV